MGTQSCPTVPGHSAGRPNPIRVLYVQVLHPTNDSSAGLHRNYFFHVCTRTCKGIASIQKKVGVSLCAHCATRNEKRFFCGASPAIVSKLLLLGWENAAAFITHFKPAHPVFPDPPRVPLPHPAPPCPAALRRAARGSAPPCPAPPVRFPGFEFDKSCRKALL